MPPGAKTSDHDEGAAVAEELRIRIKVDDGGSLAVIDRAGKELGKLKVEGESAARGIREFDVAVDRAAKSSNPFAQAMGGVTAGLKAIGSGIVVANQALQLFGSAMRGIESAAATAFGGIARAADFADMSKKIGVSVQSLSQWELAAKTAGVSLDGLGTGLKFLSRNIADAAAGGKESAEAFKQVGISAKDLNNLSTEDVFRKIADVFARTEDGAQKTAVSLKLLGRSGSELIPLLNDGSRSLDEMAELSRKLGLVLTKETAEAADAVSDRFDVLRTVSTGVLAQIGAGMIPVLDKLTKGLLDLAVNAGIANGDLKDLGAQIAQAGLDLIGPKLEALGQRVKDVGPKAAFREAGAALGDALVNGIIDSALALLPALGNRLIAGVQSIVRGFDVTKLVEAAAPSADTLATRAAIDQARGAATNARTPAQQAAAQARVAALTAEEAILRQLDAAERRTADTMARATVVTTQNTETTKANKDGKDKLAGAAGAAGDAAKKLAAELTKLDTTGAIWQRAAAGATTVAAATIDAAAAQKLASTEGITAAQAFAAAQLEARTAIDQKTAAIRADADAMAAGNAAFAEAIDSGQSLADATEAATIATQAFTEAQSLDAAGSAEATAARQAATQALREQTEARRANEAATKHSEEIADLQREAAIWTQVRDGTLSARDAQHQLAVAAERTRLIAEKFPGNVDAAAEETVRWKENVEELKGSFLDLGDILRDAFSQTFDAIVAGTRDLSDAFKGIGISIGKQLFEATLKEKFKFDGTFNANILELGGNVTKWLGGAFSSVFGGASDQASSLSGILGGGGNGGSGGGLLDLISGWLSGGSTTPGLSSNPAFAGPPTESAQSGSGAGSAIGGGIAGAAGGYAGATMFGPMFMRTTGLQGGAAFINDEVLSHMQGFNQVVSTVIGAVTGALAGGAGGGSAGGGIAGMLVGLISSVFGGILAKGIDRDALRNRQFSGTLPQIAQWGLPIPALGNVLFQMLGIPTLGTAYRRAGEGVLDSSQVFGGDDGKGGLQGLLGDYSRSSYATGRQTALDRGLTGGQVSGIAGGTQGLFAVLFGDEKFPEDMARLAEEQGNSMAEFLSRGLAKGMDYKQMLASLRGFAQEAGVTLEKAIGGLDKLYEGTVLAQKDFGHTTDLEAQTKAAQVYAESIVGIAEVFSSDVPTGVEIAQVAIESMTRDGTALFGELNQSQRDFLHEVANNPEELNKYLAQLAQQGFRIDVEKFKKDLASVAQSAQVVGQGIGQALFSGLDPKAALASIANTVQSDIIGKAQEQITTKFLESSDIASTFQGAYDVLDQLKDVDIFDPEQVKEWGGNLQAAVADGSARLQEYLPAIREIQEAFRQAFNADTVEAARVRVAEFAAQAASSLSSIVANVWTAGAQNGGKGMAEAFVAGVKQYLATQEGNIVGALFADPNGELAKGMAELNEKWHQIVADGKITPEEMFDYAQMREQYLTLAENYGDALEEAGVRAAQESGRALKESIESYEASIRNTIGSALTSAFDVLRNGGSIQTAQETFEANFRTGIYNTVVGAITEALISGALIEGALAPWLALLKEYTKAAAVDGFTPEEIDGIRAILGVIGTETDNMIRALGPVFKDVFSFLPGFLADGVETGVRTGASRVIPPGGLVPRTPAAANGGTFRTGAAVVGEAGPELAETIPGGGFRITPISWQHASQLTGLSLPAYGGGGSCGSGGCSGSTKPTCCSSCAGGGPCAGKLPGLAGGGVVYPGATYPTVPPPGFKLDDGYGCPSKYGYEDGGRRPLDGHVLCWDRRKRMHVDFGPDPVWADGNSPQDLIDRANNAYGKGHVKTVQPMHDGTGQYRTEGKGGVWAEGSIGLDVGESRDTDYPWMRAARKWISEHMLEHAGWTVNVQGSKLSEVSIPPLGSVGDPLAAAILQKRIGDIASKIGRNANVRNPNAAQNGKFDLSFTPEWAAWSLGDENALAGSLGLGAVGKRNREAHKVVALVEWTKRLVSANPGLFGAYYDGAYGGGRYGETANWYGTGTGAAYSGTAGGGSNEIGQAGPDANLIPDHLKTGKGPGDFLADQIGRVWNPATRMYDLFRYNASGQAEVAHQRPGALRKWDGSGCVDRRGKPIVCPEFGDPVWEPFVPSDYPSPPSTTPRRPGSGGGGGGTDPLAGGGGMFDIGSALSSALSSVFGFRGSYSRTPAETPVTPTPDPVTCPEGQKNENGVCVSACTGATPYWDQYRKLCAACPPGQEKPLGGGACRVPDCGTGRHWSLEEAKCVEGGGSNPGGPRPPFGGRPPFGHRPPSRGPYHPRGAATGGVFTSGPAIVGEAGMPERVDPLPGGGFRVTPLSWEEARAQLGSLPGMEGGGISSPVTIGGGGSPGMEFVKQFADALRDETTGALADAIKQGFENTEPVLKLREEIQTQLDAAYEEVVSGTMTPERAKEIAAGLQGSVQKMREEAEKLAPILAAIAKEQALNVQLNFDSALNAVASGGSPEEISKAIGESVRSAVLDAMIGALLAEGPLRTAIDAASAIVSDAMREAMADGVITEEEQKRIVDAGKGAAAIVRSAVNGVRPVIDAIGRGLNDTIDDTSGRIRELFGNAISAAFTEANGAKDFVKNFKESLYSHVRDGLIDAFMQSAIVKAAIDPLIAGFDALFESLRKQEIDLVEFRTRAMLLAQQALGEISSDEFQDAMNAVRAVLEGLAKELGVTPYRIEQSADALNRAADAVTSGCGADCELQYRLARLSIGKELLDAAGRQGIVDLEQYVPLPPPAPRPDTGVGGAQTNNPFAKYTYIPVADYLAQFPGGVSPGPYTEVDGKVETINRDWKLWQRQHGLPEYGVGGIAWSAQIARIAEREPEIIVPLSKLGGSRTERDSSDARFDRLESAIMKLAEAISQQPVRASVSIDGRELATALSNTGRVAARGRARLLPADAVA